MRSYQKMFDMVVLFFSASILLSSCGGGGGGGNDAGTSARQAVTVVAGTITLAWDPPTTNTDGTPLTDLAGYKIYYGPTSGSYTNTLDVGNVTTSVVNNLTDGLTYYFTVSAYNSAGVESSFSNEVSKTLPSTQLTLTTFTITATADIGGTITPAGTTGVTYGANQTFTIEPSAGYHVAMVLVDGVSKGAVTTYAFTSVTANHTIAATFAQNPPSTIIPDVSTFETDAAGWSYAAEGGTTEQFYVPTDYYHHNGSHAAEIGGGIISDETYFDGNIYETYYDGYIYKSLNIDPTRTMTLWAMAKTGYPADMKITIGGVTVLDWTALTENTWTQYTPNISGISSGTHEVRIYSQYSVSNQIVVDDISIPVN